VAGRRTGLLGDTILRKEQALFSHVFTSVSDFDRAYAFYASLMRALELEPRFHDSAKPWAGWQCPGGARPLFVIGRPNDGRPHAPGNGQMIAFSAKSREMVRNAYEVALSHGAQSEGPPGLRPQYHANYYGAYLRDPDGNKICVVCHSNEVAP
jgi:catechol 2,3-dioxygenase-like lactoylglutathione lyase family enzyme